MKKSKIYEQRWHRKQGERGANKNTFPHMGVQQGKGAIKLIILDLEEMGVPRMFEEIGKLAKSMMEIRYIPIGLSVVRLIKVEKNILEIQNVEIIDGTPVLDIKPYVPEFTTNDGVKIGWLEKNVHKLQQLKDDGRFS